MCIFLIAQDNSLKEKPENQGEKCHTKALADTATDRDYMSTIFKIILISVSWKRPLMFHNGEKLGTAELYA